jgi:dihydrolipoamide dehydrogenase
MEQSPYDVLVVGAGPGGYVAAIRAAQLGMKTTLVERDQMGGICLNWGCIPTKSLLRSADVLRTVKNAAQFGVIATPPSVDLPAMIARSRAIATQLNSGVAHLMQKNRIPILRGHARLLGGSAIEVTGPGGRRSNVRATHIIVATGARAQALPGVDIDAKTVWSYREALVPPSIPKRMLIIGAGAIGIEFASFYCAIGVAVTVVEMADRILPLEDEEISEHVTASLKRDGISFHLGSKVNKATRSDNGWMVELGNSVGNSVEADVILVAAGIVGNVDDIGLERTAVKVEKTHIVVDASCKTGEPGVYAIGDVAGPPWLAHKASHEAVSCVELIVGLRQPHLAPNRIPACTYSHPQVASVGLTEAAARAAGYALKIGKFPFVGNGKAAAMGSTSGFVKVVFDAENGDLLGAHMVGDEVTEMIQGFAIAQTMEATEADLMAAILPHPTMSEAMHEAVLAAFGRALHI